MSVFALAVFSCTGQINQRSIEDFNFGWRFELSDSVDYANPEYDDSQWRSLHLPHDWSIEGTFSKDNPSTPSGGALPGGIGWYRKSFEISLEPGRRAFLEFDGVFMNSSVYVNGALLGTRPYGYSSFCYDITESLRPGTNIIAVRCDNSEQPNSRWYAGCGIYRDVRLVTTAATHVDYNGLFVSTDGNIVNAQVEVSDDPESVDFLVTDAKGRRVAAQSAERGDDGCWRARFQIPNVHFWDISDPYLYSITAIVDGGMDEYSCRFGFRTIAWDADKGFFLNGRHVKLLGVCQHHDQGCIGAAFHKRALERQLTILREMGVNAIRCSHNPPAPQFLDMCDEMGFLVIDEGMDMWRKKKTAYDYARFFDEWHERDLSDLVKRDRNHPCVILWSIGNEIPEQWNSNEDIIENLSAEQANLLMNFMSSLPQYEAGEDNPNVLLTKHMAAIVRDLDTTRLITAGLNETGPHNNLIRSGALDVYGFNYHTWDYDKVRDWYPNIPILGTETASSLNSRGFYPQPSTDTQRQPLEWWMTCDAEHHQCPSYDIWCAPWSDLHSHAWVEVRDREWMAGCFLWTGFDYLGEPTPYTWPSRSSYFGCIDLAGFPKDSYYMYQSEWTSKTVMHLFPHWNWSEGDTVDIWCYYSNADEVELFLNGRSLGRSSKRGEQLRAQWLAVPFEPGTIEAISYKDGQEVARDSHTTTGEPVALRLAPDRATINADGYDLSFVTITAVDAYGREVPTATDMLQFSVDGTGELLGVDNGNAADTLSLKGSQKALFAGKALAVVRSINDSTGVARLTVSAPYDTKSIDINTK